MRFGEQKMPFVVVDAVDPTDFLKLITYHFPNAVAEFDDQDNLKVRSLDGCFTASWTVSAWAGCHSQLELGTSAKVQVQPGKIVSNYQSSGWIDLESAR